MANVRELLKTDASFRELVNKLVTKERQESQGSAYLETSADLRSRIARDWDLSEEDVDEAYGFIYHERDPAWEQVNLFFREEEESVSYRGDEQLLPGGSFPLGSIYRNGMGFVSIPYTGKDQARAVLRNALDEIGLWDREILEDCPLGGTKIFTIEEG